MKGLYFTTALMAIFQSKAIRVLDPLLLPCRQMRISQLRIVTAQLPLVFLQIVSDHTWSKRAESWPPDHYRYTPNRLL